LFQTPLDFLNLFVRPPGDLLYFLAVVILSLASLFMALGERWRQPQNRDSGRYTLASLGIVTAWVLLMLGALYAIVVGQDASSILPPLERAANVIAILLITWAFLTADHNRWERLPNIIVLVLMVIVIAGYVITGVQWAGTSPQSNFNLSLFGVAWTFIPTILSIVGLLLILAYFRLVTDAPLKLVFFVILLLGYGGSLLQIAQGNLIGNYTGPARLAFMAALPILPAIIYRMVLSHLQSELAYQAQTNFQAAAPPQQAAAPPASSEPRKAPESNLLPVATAPTVSPIQRDSIQLLKTLGLILEEATPTSIPQRVVTAGLEVLKGEVGAVLTLQDANYADITAAFDKSKSEAISGLALNLDNQPTLVNAIERRLQRPLYPDRNLEELRDLYNRLDITGIGPTYFQPLISGKELVAILLIGMPYSGRELEESERELLKGIGIIAGNLLALSFAARDARLKAEERAIQALVQGIPLEEVKDDSVLAAHQEMQASLQLSREQIGDLGRQVMELKVELDYERNRVASILGDTEEGLSVSQRILALNDEQQRLRDEKERLASRLQDAETALAGATATSNDAVVKSMIESLRREKDELLTQRENLLDQLNEIRAGVVESNTAPQKVQEVLEKMSQEKAQMEVERGQLTSKLADIESQLKALGIENGTAGLTQLIGQMTEQRATLQAKIETLTLERNALLNERTQFQQSIDQEKERETRIGALQNEIKYLAADREAVTKQRDQLRMERDDLFAKQESFKQQRARLIAEASGYQVELAEEHQEQAKLRVQIQQLADERSDLISLRDRLVGEKQALETERDLLMARSDGNRERLQQLGEDGVGSLTKMIEDVSEQRNSLERELNDTRTSLAAIQNELEMLQVQANARTESVGGAGALIQTNNPDVFLGMVQELRTPLTSIVGYVDLLLDESAGILGEMQRRFLQRVAANVTRLTFMLEDLTRVTALDNSRFTLMPEPVDVVGLIEDAISNSTYEFREKELTVHLNLDDNVPAIRADRDAISQIISQLLTNAYLASPINSPIIVTAHRQQVQLSQHNNLANPTDCLLLSVEDRGGGIAPEDLPRVFARKYKAENPAHRRAG
jgi:signal transduction histidine kinase